MSSDSDELGRYAAKLLFQYRVTGATWENKRRLCEETIVLVHAVCAGEALKIAKKRGRTSQLSYKNSDGNRVRFEFVGVLDLLELGVECKDDEVWYEIHERLLPMERKSALIPAESELCAIRNERRDVGLE
jgi:hypothetical protein